jgi:hypothetical protein
MKKKVKKEKKDYLEKINNNILAAQVFLGNSYAYENNNALENKEIQKANHYIKAAEALLTELIKIYGEKNNEYQLIKISITAFGNSGEKKEEEEKEEEVDENNFRRNSI